MLDGLTPPKPNLEPNCTLSLFEEQGVGIVMTDVFVSATAALLMVLAIARPAPPTPLPIQAEITVSCETSEQGEYVFQAWPTHILDAERRTILSPEDFAVAVQQMNLPKALLYKVVVIGKNVSGLPAGCLQAFKTAVIWPLNKDPVFSRESENFRTAIFSVTASRPLDEAEDRQ